MISRLIVSLLSDSSPSHHVEPRVSKRTNLIFNVLTARNSATASAVLRVYSRKVIFIYLPKSVHVFNSSAGASALPRLDTTMKRNYSARWLHPYQVLSYLYNRKMVHVDLLHYKWWTLTCCRGSPSDSMHVVLSNRCFHIYDHCRLQIYRNARPSRSM